MDIVQEMVYRLWFRHGPKLLDVYEEEQFGLYIDVYFWGNNAGRQKVRRFFREQLQIAKNANNSKNRL